MLKKQIIAGLDPDWVKKLKEWMNSVADEVNRNLPRGDGSTTLVNDGVVTALRKKWPGVAYVYGQRFYDADYYTEVEDQVGTAIGGTTAAKAAKKWIKITIIAQNQATFPYGELLDPDNASTVTVSYVDAPDPAPGEPLFDETAEAWTKFFEWENNAIYLRTADYTEPPIILQTRGVAETSQIGLPYQLMANPTGGEPPIFGFGMLQPSAVDPTDAGTSMSGYPLIAGASPTAGCSWALMNINKLSTSGASATVKQAVGADPAGGLGSVCEWVDIPELPSGVHGDILWMDGTGEWVAHNDPTDPAMLLRDAQSIANYSPQDELTTAPVGLLAVNSTPTSEANLFSVVEPPTTDAFCVYDATGFQMDFYEGGGNPTIYAFDSSKNMIASSMSDSKQILIHDGDGGIGTGGNLPVSGEYMIVSDGGDLIFNFIADNRAASGGLLYKDASDNLSWEDVTSYEA